jgi:4-hydroxyphenylpyruvate dioxygenase
MHLSIATVCLSGTLTEKLEAIAAAGFETVEVFENDLLSFPGAIPDLKRLADDLGLKIAVFQPFRDFEGMPAHRREKTFDRAERKFDVMAALGCDLLMVCSNVAPDSLGGVDRAAADLRELGSGPAGAGCASGMRLCHGDGT